MAEIKIKKIIPVDTVLEENKNWFSFIKDINKASTLRQLFITMFLIGVYVTGFVYVHEEIWQRDEKISATIHSILGITMGLLLVIRTNTAYDRWWEGRRLVGGLVNSTRNLAIKLNSVIPAEETAVRQRFAGLIGAYFTAMKEHLRQGVKFEELTADLPANEIEQLKHTNHVPNAIASTLYSELHGLHKRGLLTGHQLQMLDRQAEDFTNVCGGCERIKKTPLPMAYRLHLKLFILVYITTLPFGLIHELKYFTIPAVILVFYAMVGMEIIAEEIEDPFGRDANDIPMDNISVTIHHNVYEVLCPNQVETKKN